MGRTKRSGDGDGGRDQADFAGSLGAHRVRFHQVIRSGCHRFGPGLALGMPRSRKRRGSGGHRCRGSLPRARPCASGGDEGAVSLGRIETASASVGRLTALPAPEVQVFDAAAGAGARGLIKSGPAIADEVRRKAALLTIHAVRAPGRPEEGWRGRARGKARRASSAKLAAGSLSPLIRSSDSAAL